jgi:hypothetical protein
MIRLSFLALLVTGQAVATQPQPTMPAPFQGEWHLDLADCGTSVDDSLLLIGADHIIFYKTRGRVRAVVLKGESEIALIAELQGVDETWLSYSHFRLSQDGTQLTDITGNGSDVLFRCPRPNNSFKPKPLRGSA